jgi:adenylosuccinate synthase
MIETGKVNFLIDGQWGSTGKGKLAGYLYEQYKNLTMAISDNMPNAGHTFTRDGKNFIFKALPTGVLFDGVTSLIGPQAVIGEEQLQIEMEMVKNEIGHYPKLMIHPMASVVTASDKNAESEIVSKMASTGQGSCAATVKKMWRAGEANLAKNSKILDPFVADIHAYMQHQLKNGGTALSEGSQGFDLSMHCGHSYPHVTSRDCLIGRMMDNAGCPVKSVGSIIACLRTLPIRVGSTENTSGPYYDDQTELDWKAVSEMCGYDVEEKTTVTQRIRRVFTFSEAQTRKFCEYVRPDYAFLNFVNYYSDPTEEIKAVSNVANILDEYDCDLTLLGTGAELDAMTVTNNKEILDGTLYNRDEHYIGALSQ